VVPDKDLWFWLDENTGTETIYVLASEKPMSDIRELLTKMVAAGREENFPGNQEENFFYTARRWWNHQR